jgi:transposase
MADDLVGVIGGFDCHIDFHAAVALDSLGQLLGTEFFPATSDGYRKALGWVSGFGPVIAVGVESTGSYGSGLSRFLANEGLRVIEVNQPHPHTRTRRGKDDAIDAEAAARKVLSGEATGAAKDSTGIVESIRQLTVARTGATKARTAALCQFRDLVITAPAPIRENLAVRRTLESKARLCVRTRPNPGTPTNPVNAAKVALRSVARRIQHLAEEIKELDARLKGLIAIAAPGTLRRLGLGTHNTTTLLTAAGENIERFSSEASFAHLCGVAPIPATSGRTRRHRLNHAGNRQANRALHMIAIVRLLYCGRTQAYMERRLTEGKTKREVLRCLKRYLVREIYRTLRADLTTLSLRT